jgi:hypothetical protein
LLDENEVFEFLDDLRDSGVTNMFGARPYIMEEFNIDLVDAGKLLSFWMNIHGERHS